MKRSKSRVNVSYDLTQGMDIERCQEELLKSRIKYNKLNQNYLELKVEYNKLEKDYKYNIKIMQSIINESNIAALTEFLEDPKMNNTNTINEKEDNNEIIKQNNLSKTTIKILKEKSIYEKLKLEIMNLRDELKTKENTINDLKDNVKTSKFRELDSKFAQMFQEFNALKARNQVLENMQTDYVNSKNQIIFLLKQIDLYKKDNKKLKELYEKILYDYQNVSRQKEAIENSKNLNEERIKALISKNQNLKVKIEDLKIKNLAYYEELERYKNLNQSQIDKLLLRKEREISQYRGQITQLKMEIGTWQKKADERNKMNMYSASTAGFKKIKPIHGNKIDNKELRKTDSDFFVTKPKSVFGNDKKIVINSKINKKTFIDNNKIEKKISLIKIKDNKKDISYIKAEEKHENSDILNNYYEKKIPTIKEGKNMNDKKTTANEEDINIDLDYKKNVIVNKEEEREKSQKENNISKELKESNKKEENNNDDIKMINVENKNIDVKEKDEKKENEYKEENEEEEDDDKKTEDKKIPEINKENNLNKENIIENKENPEEDKLKKVSNINRGNYKEEEIVVNMSNDNDKTNKEKKNESSYGYNDFDSNIDQKSYLKQNSNTNINNDMSNEQKDKLKDINAVSIEQKDDFNELNNNDLNKQDENENKILKENNAHEIIQKNELKDNNNFAEEKSVKIDKEKKEEDDESEEYKFSEEKI